MSDSIRKRFNLTGKVAIVTGASKGIGESIARGLAEFGAKVMVSSRKQEAVDAVAKAIQAAGGEADAVAAHAGSTSDLHGPGRQDGRAVRRRRHHREQRGGQPGVRTDRRWPTKACSTRSWP